MAIEETPKDPARVRLETLIEHCEKRAARAAAKLDAAVLEDYEARSALESARRALDQWIKDNPDPQPMLI